MSLCSLAAPLILTSLIRKRYMFPEKTPNKHLKSLTWLSLQWCGMAWQVSGDSMDAGVRIKRKWI